MLSIANGSTCTGCHACYSICPVGAISMDSDSEGFLRPVINNKTCIRCGRCESVCPVLHPLKLPVSDPVAFACKNTNEEIRLKSSSGGVFTALAEKVIEQGGVVFAARFDDDFTVIHDWTDARDALDSFRGSKYVQSRIGDSFKKCKQFLEEGKIVLFSGTPCQIGGLKAFLGKEYEKLFTVDIICHGVPSPLLWKKYIEYRQTTAGSTIQKIYFRRKETGWKNYSVQMSFKDKKHYVSPYKDDPYMKIFLKDIALRKSCYCCGFKGARRVSDITLADFWGIQNILPSFDDTIGTSLVLIHSEKGRTYFQSLEVLHAIKVNLVEALSYNKASLYSAKQPTARKYFFNDLSSKQFTKIVKVYAKDTVFQKMVPRVKRVARKILKLRGVKRYQ